MIERFKPKYTWLKALCKNAGVKFVPPPPPKLVAVTFKRTTNGNCNRD